MSSAPNSHKRLRHVRRILIVKPSSLGDIVHTFKAVQLLYENYPKATFDWVVNPEFAKLVDYAPTPRIRRIIFKRKKLGKLLTFIPEAFRLVHHLRKYKYDIVIDFQGLLRSAIITRLARSRSRAGFANPKEPMAAKFYKRKITLPPDCRQAVDRYLSLARSYCSNQNLVAPLLLHESYKNITSVKAKLKDRNLSIDDQLIAVFPSARWKSKTFPQELFKSVIEKLLVRFPEANILLLGTMDDYKEVNSMVSQLSKNSRVFNMFGSTSTGSLVELLRACSLTISNDSGPLHLSAALNVPTIAFYGPTDPTYTGPDGAAVKIFQTNAECKNCLQKECQEHNYICHNLDADEVFQTAVSMITNPAMQDNHNSEQI